MALDPINTNELLDNRYRVIRRVAQGGMGAVLEAFDERLQRVVAVKVVRPELVKDPVARARFDREARAAAAVTHPAVVQVFDLGVTPTGVAFLVMEWMEGSSLANILRTEGRLDPGRAASLVEQALRGLAAAHAIGIVHRDLKPGNLMVRESHGRESIKVVDFGVAHLKRGEEYTRLTMTGEIIGTPAYMPPEQLEGKNIGPAVDIYAMGVVLWCLLVGKQPFGSGPEVLLRVLTTTPLRADAEIPTVPRALADIAERAMQRQPEARFGSANEMADALDAFRRGETPSPPRAAHSLRPDPSGLSGITNAGTAVDTITSRPPTNPGPHGAAPFVAPPAAPTISPSLAPVLNANAVAWPAAAPSPALAPAPAPSTPSRRWIAVAIASAIVLTGVVMFVFARRTPAEAAHSADPRMTALAAEACERARRCCIAALPAESRGACDSYATALAAGAQQALASCSAVASSYAASAAQMGRTCDGTVAIAPSSPQTAPAPMPNPVLPAPVGPAPSPGTVAAAQPTRRPSGGGAAALAATTYRCCLRAYAGSSQCDVYRQIVESGRADRFDQRNPGMLSSALREFRERAAGLGTPCESTTRRPSEGSRSLGF